MSRKNQTTQPAIVCNCCSQSERATIWNCQFLQMRCEGDTGNGSNRCNLLQFEDSIIAN